MWTRPLTRRESHLAATAQEGFEREQRSFAFFHQFSSASARPAFERPTNVWPHRVDATNEAAARLDGQCSAVSFVNLHKAAIAYEMREGLRFVVHTVVIDAEDADVFGQSGEAARPAEQAIGGDGDATRHGGSRLELRAGRRAGSAAIDAAFVGVLHGIGAGRGNAHTGFAHTALTIVRRDASFVVGAFVAIGTAAVEAGFVAVLEGIGAAWCRAHAVRAHAARALREIRAL